MSRSTPTNSSMSLSWPGWRTDSPSSASHSARARPRAIGSSHTSHSCTLSARKWTPPARPEVSPKVRDGRHRPSDRSELRKRAWPPPPISPPNPMPSEETWAKWSSLPVAGCTLRSGEREKRKARESPNQGCRRLADVRGHGVGKKAPKTRGLIGSGAS
eukprot:scaffold4545_cov111-Isochrysis_galbana.AAC.12